MIGIDCLYEMIDDLTRAILLVSNAAVLGEEVGLKDIAEELEGYLAGYEEARDVHMDAARKRDEEDLNAEYVGSVMPDV